VRTSFLESIRFRYGRWLMLRHIRRSQRAFVERAERNPWIHEYRAVKAEVERTGDDSLFADFEPLQAGRARAAGGRRNGRRTAVGGRFDVAGRVKPSEGPPRANGELLAHGCPLQIGDAGALHFLRRGVN
jgi:hypothetical protein